MIDDQVIIRKKDFFKQLKLSSTTITNYKAALNSRYLKETLKEEFGVADIFEIDDIDKLWKLYVKVNAAPKNIDNHRAYSAPIMKYIRFLNNGDRVGRRIDFNKPRNRKKRSE